MLEEDEPEFPRGKSYCFTVLDKANIELLEVGETFQSENEEFSVELTDSSVAPYVLRSQKSGILYFENIEKLIDHLEEDA